MVKSNVSQSLNSIVEARAHWLELFSKGIPQASFPMFLEEQAEPKREVYRYELPQQLAQSLLTTAEHHLHKAFMIGASVVAAALHKYSGETELVLGVPPLAVSKHQTLPIKLHLSPEHSFQQLVGNVRQAWMEGIRNQQFTLLQLADELGVSVNQSGHGMFTVGVAFDPLHQVDVLFTTRPDICVVMEGNEDDVALQFHYERQRFTPAFIKSLAEHIGVLMRELFQRPTTPIEHVRLIGEKEWASYVQVPVVKNGPTVMEMFEAQVARTPDQIAVRLDAEALTYAALNDQANRVMNALTKQGVATGTVVGLMVERSLAMAAGMLGILKAGAVYLPMDPQLPEERIAFMLEDAGVEIVLTTADLLWKVARLNVSFLDLKECLQVEPGHPLTRRLRADDLAYIIYTSGTTGRPKGVFIEQGGIANSIAWRKEAYQLDTNDRVLQLFSNAFDGFMTSFLTPLVSGATVVMMNELASKDVRALKQLILAEEVTHFIMIPPLFDALLETLQPNEVKSLRTVTLAGDKVTAAVVRKAKELLPQLEIVNEYGPTESSVVATYKRAVTEATVGSIGHPIDNATVYIMDEQLQLVPIGVTGEIVIGGAGLARGYVNRPDLTAEKFVTHAHPDIGRLYRTGDKGRLLPNGEFEFLGRMDDQVKISGYRIEPGEIEAVLQQLEGIKEAIVQVVEGQHGDQQLCGYYTTNDALTASQVRQQLAEWLPFYMIPAYLYPLQQFPLTAIGKIDRHQLPNPFLQTKEYEQFTAPSTETERQLSELWCELLQQEKMSVHANFFEMGGQSLKGSVLIARIANRMGVDIALSDLFEFPTIQQLAAHIDRQEQRDRVAIPAIAERVAYPLSPAQQRMYLLHEFDNTGIAYNTPMIVRVEGPFNVEQLRIAMGQLLQRHEAFSTAFIEKDGELLQQIHSPTDVKIDIVSLGDRTIEEVMAHFIRPFDLAAGRLFRLALVAVSENEHYLLFDSHHIVADGISMWQLFQQFVALYKGEALPEKRIDYKDYAVWQLEQMHSEEMQAEASYWLTKLSDELPILNFPTDFERPVVQQFDGATLSFSFSPALSAALTALAEQEQASVYMVLLGIYKVLLQKYTGQEDIIVGTPVAGRSHVDVEEMIGMFVNTLPIRTFPTKDKSFRAFLQEVKETILSDMAHQHYPFDTLVQELQVEKDTSRNPLFDTMFTLHNHDREALIVDDLQFSFVPFEQQMSKFDFSIDVEPTEHQIECTLRYNTHLFEEATMRAFIDRFMHVAEQIVQKPTAALQEIELVDEVGRQWIFQTMNDTAVEYGPLVPIYRLVEAQVSRTPQANAVVCDEERLTYAELNGKANAVAKQLVDRGCGPGSYVPILMNRSVEMAISIFAVLKTGAAFCPMDVQWPVGRIETIVKDLGASFLLTNVQHPVFSAIAIEPIEIKAAALSIDERNLPVEVTIDDLMYIIYTSGSTGVPKGVKVPYRGILNRFYWMNEEFGQEAAASVLNTTNYVYDSAVWQLFWPLMNGGKTVIPGPDEVLIADYVTTIIEKEEITLTDFVPSVFDLIVQQLKEDTRYHHGLQSLQTIIIGGEALTPSTVMEFLTIFPHVKPYNLYGPTEASIGCIYYQITGTEEGRLPIGKPIANTEIYLLDEQLHVVPIGVEGEIYITGECLAEGYLNDDEKTAAAFIDNPYRPSFNPRMYKTGDLAKLLPNGQIDFLGRVDSQVKIRGLRIELQEIERQLFKHPQVNEAVVNTVDVDGDVALCAYYTATQPVLAAALKHMLSEVLPVYMIPTYYMQLDEIPIASSGKVDRKALPIPERTAMTASAYVAPTTEKERQLADIWATLLHREQVGIEDSFFDLGGDSIKALQLISRMRAIQLHCTLPQLFANPTIAQLAKVVTEEAVTNEEQGIIEGPVLLTPIQRRFFAQQESHLHYNQAMIFTCQQPLDPQVLDVALTKLVEHHDALRLQFAEENGQVRQWNEGTAAVFHELQVVYLQDAHNVEDAIQHYANGLQASIRLDEGPLLKAMLFETAKETYVLLALHHLVVDGVSWRILLEDLTTLVGQAESGQALNLPPKTTSYKSWATELVAYRESAKLLKEVPYWEQVVKEPVAELPKAMNAPLGTYHELDSVTITLDEVKTTQLVRSVHRAYQTEMNDVLLAALGVALQKWSGQSNYRIDLEGHGREMLTAAVDISRTVGWFTSVYPVVLPMNSHTELSAILRATKEMLRKVPNKGIGFGILQELSSATHPIDWQEDVQQAELSFNYLGQLDSETVQDDARFSLSSMPVGDMVSKNRQLRYGLELTGQIRQGVFSMTVDYSTLQYKGQQIKQFAALYEAALQEIITHCTAIESPVLTPSDYGTTALTLEELDRIQAAVQAPIERIYPLSPMQEGMLFHSVFDPTSHSYFEQNRLRVQGKIDEAIFTQSFQYIIQRYAIFRTAFIHERLRQPMQVVLKERPGQVQFHDFSTLSIEERDRALYQVIESDKKKGFHLSQDVLLRATVCKIEDDAYEIIWSEHHILMDGWCLGIVMKEFFTIYEAIAKGETPNLEEVQPYERYIQWLQEQDEKKAEAFWQVQLDDFQTPSVVSHAARKLEGEPYAQQMISYRFSEALTAQLQEVAKRYAVTLNTVFQSLWSVFLHKYNQSNDVLFGTVVSGRSPDIQGVEQMIGLFINTLPLRTRVEAGMSFPALLQTVQDTLVAADQYSYYPLASIQAQVGLGSELFNHLVVFENHPLNEEMQALQQQAHTAFTIQEAEAFEQTNYDFNVIVVPGNELEVNFIFNANVYAVAEVENARNYFTVIAEQLIHQPEAILRDVSMVPAEQWTTLQALNDTTAEFPKEATLVSLFEQQAKAVPNHVALVCRKERFTYTEVNERANQLAHFLLSQGVKKGEIIAIIDSSSIDMVISILAILKAGAAYMPIDPQYPQDRIDFMITDSGTQWILTTEAYNHLVQTTDRVVILLEDERIAKSLQTNVTNVHTPQDLAYIIYTSGTTGLPKGVMISHRNVVRLLFNDRLQFEFTADDVWTVFHSFCFDFSVWEMYGALLYGGKLVVIPKEDARDPNAFHHTLVTEKVTVLNQTPTAFQGLIRIELAQPQAELSLRYIIFGGEPLKPIILQQWHERYPQTKLVNMYGITETTVHVTFKEVGAYEISNNISNIGKPIPTLRVYVLDADMNAVPLGVPGELYVSGEGVALGYLNRPELTKERFFTHTFTSAAGEQFEERLYRSGDIVRILPNGELEYAGRSDDQVKIRGHRIEIGEIIATLLKHPAIDEGTVLVREDEAGQKYLVAYYVTTVDQDVNDIRSFLTKQLPAYMIPNYLIPLSAFPMTSNGKIDKKALPAPETIVQSNTNYVAPVTPKEQQLAKVWEEVLGIEPIGRLDHFFALGGDSIKALQIYSRLRTYGLKLEMKDLFAYPALQEAALYVQEDAEIAEQEMVEGDVPLTPIQKAYFARQETDLHFNQAMLLKMLEPLEETLLNEALTKLMEHHDALRMQFEVKNDKVRQRNAHVTEVSHELHVVDFQETEQVEEAMEAYVNELQASIWLDGGPLLKAVLFQLKEESHLLLAIHHLVVDGVSWRILLEDLTTLLQQAASMQPLELPAKTVSFKRWAEQLTRYRNHAKLLKEASYWEKIAKTPIAPLPKDKHGLLGTYEETGSVSIALPKEQTEQLQRHVHQAYQTEMNDVLLAAFGLALQRWSGHAVHRIDMEGHGRQPLETAVDISRTIGWFTSIYPVVLEIHQPDDLSYTLRLTKETLRRIPNKGMGYGIVTQIESEEAPLSWANEVENAEISFNYLGDYDTSLQGAAFTLSSYSIGQAASAKLQRPYGMDVSGKIVGGQLQLSIDYSTTQFAHQSMTKLIQLYQQGLEELIEHCAGATTVVQTPSDVGDIELTIEELEHIQQAVQQPIAKVYPLTPMQQGMFYNALVQPESSAYFEQATIRLSGAVDVARLAQCQQAITDKYEIFRTLFVHEQLQQPRQVVLEHLETDIETIDLRHVAPQRIEDEIEQLVQLDKERSFHLSQAPLSRMTWIQCSEEQSVLIWSFHHILIDGWSMGLVMKEFFDCYEQLRTTGSFTMEATAPYSRYIAWLHEQEIENATTFWSTYLADFDTVTELPFEKKEQTGEFTLEELAFTFGEALTERIQALSKSLAVTVNTIVQAAWGIVLQKYNHHSDVLFGAVVSGRPPAFEGIETMVGLFINTIPVRVKTSATSTFESVVKEMQQASLAAEPYNFYPLYEMPAEGLNGRPLLHHVMAFENYPLDESVKGNQQADRLGFEITSVDMFEQINYPFGIVVLPGSNVTMKFTYNAHVFESADMHKLQRHFLNVLEQVVDEPTTQLRQVSLLSAQEQETLLNDVKHHDTEESRSTVIDLFEEQVARTPQQPAIIFQEKSLTYAELNEQAENIRYALHLEGMEKGQVIGLMMERSIEMAPGILGIFKAGGVYLPIDPQLPDDRIAFMLQDAGVQLIMTTKDLLWKVAKLPVACLDITASLTEKVPSQAPQVLQGDDLAYIIYTSGTTGQPKGVFVEHRGIANSIAWRRDAYQLDETDRVLQLFSNAFDGFMTSFLTPIVSGATVVMMDDVAAKDVHALKQLIGTHRITHFIAIPALFDALLDTMTAEEAQSLRIITLAGDKVTASVVQRAKKLQPTIEIVNEYGPTESSVVATYKRDVTEEAIGSIGRPIVNTTVYIMDESLQLMPIGTAGEIVIGGAGLARGYVNRPDLTAEKFVMHPHPAIGRLYRTGDKGRWLPNGEIEFLGRMDDQVKISGYRIEPGEIEAVLYEVEGIKEAVVLAVEKEPHQFVLCAYFTTTTELAEAVIRNQLAVKLPPYMLPNYYYPLEAMPTTRTGKIDRKQLAALPMQVRNESVDHSSLSETEQQLFAIWKDKLGHEEFTIDDHFFEIGGNSLKLMQVQVDIEKKVVAGLTITDLFTYPTIAQLASFIDGQQETVVLLEEEKVETRISTVIEDLESGELSIEDALKSLQDLEEI